MKDSIMGRTRTMGTFDNSQWKSFINFERKNHQFQQKELLKDEKNNIAIKLVKSREMKAN